MSPKAETAIGEVKGTRRQRGRALNLHVGSESDWRSRTIQGAETGTASHTPNNMGLQQMRTASAVSESEHQMNEDIRKYRAKIHNFQTALKKSTRVKLLNKKPYCGMDGIVRKRLLSMSLDFRSGAGSQCRAPPDHFQWAFEQQTDDGYRSNWCKNELDRLQNSITVASDHDSNMYASLMKSPQDRDPAVLLRERRPDWPKPTKYSTTTNKASRARAALFRSIEDSR